MPIYLTISKISRGSHIYNTTYVVLISFHREVNSMQLYGLKFVCDFSSGTLVFSTNKTDCPVVLSKNTLTSNSKLAVIPLTGLALPHFCACPGTWFLSTKVVVFFLDDDLRREVIVHFVDIGGIVDNHFFFFS